MQEGNFNIFRAPEGFELKPLTTDLIKKINKAWPGRFANSEKFIEEAIKYNPSMGLYDKDGELVAWNMRYFLFL